MTFTQRLARFVATSQYDDLPADCRDALRISVLDAVGCAAAALGSDVVSGVGRYVHDQGGNGQATLIGGGQSTLPLAALFNSAAIRYLDFNDTYSTRREGCHPSDSIGPVLAACEYADRSGAEFLHCLAVAYEVQARMLDATSIRDKGFDQPSLSVYAMVAGVARALGARESETAHALAIGGSSCNALRAVRTGALSHWKGLSNPNAGMNAVHAVLLARQGITGPLEVVEGTRGLMSAITGPFTVDWSAPRLGHATACTIKRHNAEGNAQTAVEAVLALSRRHRIDPRVVEAIEVETFEAALTIIGGGIEGDKHTVATKEQADHSLPYIVAVALLDGEVTPRQYLPGRIHAPDVQGLLRKVSVREEPSYSARFPPERPTRVTVVLAGGARYTEMAAAAPGSPLRPFTWADGLEKFSSLVQETQPASLVDELAQAVRDLPELASVRTLTALLGRLRTPSPVAA